MASVLTIDFECCGAKYSMPTGIPDNGSILHHTSAVGTAEVVLEAVHAQEHPECEQ